MRGPSVYVLVVAGVVTSIPTLDTNRRAGEHRISLCHTLLLFQVALREARRTWQLRLKPGRVCSVPTREIIGVAALVSMDAIIVFVRTRQILIAANAVAVLVVTVAIRTPILRSRVGAIGEKRSYHQDQHGAFEYKSTNLSGLHCTSFR
jgi:hypothetical protein